MTGLTLCNTDRMPQPRVKQMGAALLVGLAASGCALKSKHTAEAPAPTADYMAMETDYTPAAIPKTDKPAPYFVLDGNGYQNSLTSQLIPVRVFA